MATFASVAGIKLPENDREGKPIIFDSFDMTPVLTGAGKSPRKTWFYFTENELSPGAIRVNNYKFAFNIRGDDGASTGGLAVDSQSRLERRGEICRHGAQVFDLWQDPQERYDIFMNNFTERTWMGVVMGEELKKIMATYVKYPPRKLQSFGYTGPITLSNYERFQWVARPTREGRRQHPDADRQLKSRGGPGPYPGRHFQTDCHLSIMSREDTQCLRSPIWSNGPAIVAQLLRSHCFSRSGTSPDRSIAVLERHRPEGGHRRLRRKVTKEGSADFVPEPERIAVFDNDGTLWVEQPMYTQLAFALDRVKAERPRIPEWKDTQPFKAVLEGDMKTLAASRRKGPRGTHHGDPCRNDHRRVPEDRLRLDRDGTRSAFQASLHRARLPADARTARLSARQRLQDVHRLGRRHRDDAPMDREDLWHSARAGRGLVDQDAIRDAGWTCRPCSACRKSTSSTTRPASRSASTSISAAARLPRSAIPTATSRCCNGRRWATGPRFGLIVHHTDAEREYAYDRQVALRPARHGPRCGHGEPVDGGRHEEGLEGRLSVRIEVIPKGIRSSQHLGVDSQAGAVTCSGSNYARQIPGALAIASCLVAHPLLIATASAQQSKPNILFILADNIGYGDIGVYGGGELRGAPTPRIDQLAAESLRLTQFLVEPSCTPSRAALMTGRYSIRSGLSLVAVAGTHLLAAGEGNHHGRDAARRRLRHCDIRQVAPRRANLQPAAEPGFRRVLRHPAR